MSKEYAKIIHDEEELKWFFDHIMPDLEATECYFLSLAARNKYLTSEERVEIELGRTEMFEKRIVRKKEWDRLLRTLRKLECDTRGYTTKTGSPIPSKALVCYFNINPSNTIRALANFQAIINEYFIELSTIAFEQKRDSSNIANRINKIDNNLMTCYQQATGTRTWLDFDFDIPKSDAFLALYSTYLDENGFEGYYWVDTKSGYHLLLKKEQLKQNPQNLVDNAIEMIFSMFRRGGVMDESFSENWEIVYNKNAMIPMPGTYQGDHKVIIINK